MKKIILFITILLLAGLILIGGGCGGDSAQSFYKNYCKTYIDSFQDNLARYFDNDTEVAKAMGGHFSNVDECVEKKVKEESDLLKGCKTDCDELKKNYREIGRRTMTRQGCTNLWGSLYCSAYKVEGRLDIEEITPKDRATLDRLYGECMAEINELCGSLPESVNW